MTFEQMIAIEPKLEKLLRTAESIIDDGTQPSFCARSIWYCGYSIYTGHTLRTRLSRLVGYHAANRELNKPGLYELAESTLLAAMPKCRNCACLAIPAAPPPSAEPPLAPTRRERKRFLQPHFGLEKYARLTDIAPICASCGQPMPHPKQTKKEKAAA